MTLDPNTVSQILGFYSIGLHPPTAHALIAFAQKNLAPAIDIRAGVRGFNLAGLEPDVARVTLDELRRAAPIRMLTTDVDLGDLINDPEPALEVLWRLHDLLDQNDKCALRILARHTPAQAEVETKVFAATVARLPHRPLQLELHNPDWFRIPMGESLIASFVNGSTAGLAVFELLIDSHQITKVLAVFETGYVKAVLQQLSPRIGMVHLCNPGDGLDPISLRLIAEIVASRDTVPISFEFTGPRRQSKEAAQAYLAACRDWKEALARVACKRQLLEQEDATGSLELFRERPVQ